MDSFADVAIRKELGDTYKYIHFPGSRVARLIEIQYFQDPVSLKCLEIQYFQDSGFLKCLEIQYFQDPGFLKCLEIQYFHS